MKGGMLFKVSLGMARRMLAARGGITLLQTLGAKIGFEVTVGRNGLVHVDGGNIKATLAIGQAIQEVDVAALGDESQKKLAAATLKQC